MNKLKEIMGVIKALMGECFTGVLTLKIHFNQGGIRDVIKSIENRL